MDRSPAAEALFQNSDKYEAKSAGLSELTENPVTNQTIKWAEIIFVMDERNEQHKTLLLEKFPQAEDKDIRILNIKNEFCRYDKELERLLRVKLEREGINVSLSKRNDLEET